MGVIGENDKLVSLIKNGGLNSRHLRVFQNCVKTFHTIFLMHFSQRYDIISNIKGWKFFFTLITNS